MFSDVFCNNTTLQGVYYRAFLFNQDFECFFLNSSASYILKDAFRKSNSTQILQTGIPI